MFFDSVERFAETNAMLDPFNMARMKDKYLPSLGQSIWANMATAFDRTSGVRLWENWRISDAEQKATEAGTIYKYKDAAEYEASPEYVPDVPWEEGMTAERMRIIKAGWEKRRRHEMILNSSDRNGNPWLRMPLNFGAGVIGSLPDPINVLAMLIPGGQVLGLLARYANLYKIASL